MAIKQERFSAQEKWELFSAITIKGGLYTPPSTFGSQPGFFSLDNIKKKRESLAVATKLKREDAIYVHIPFCKGKRCLFCMYPSIIKYDYNDVTTYVERIFREFSYWKDSMLTRLRSFYVGGGTPSILTSKQIKDAFKPILDLPYLEKAERTCEVSPFSIDKKKIKTLHDIGFNRLSIGVQSLDPVVLNSVNRDFASYEYIKSLVEYALENNFLDVNVDMMIGLANENIDNICLDIEKILCSGALSLTVYICRNLHIKSEIEEQERRKRVEKTLLRIYDIVKDYNWICEQGNTGTEYNCFSSPKKQFKLLPHLTYGDGFRNYNLWGFGAKAISVTPAMAYKCNSYDLEFSSSAKRYKIYTYNIKQQMQLALCTMLYSSNMTIDCKLFEKAFGIKIEDAFFKELQELEQLNKLEMDSRFIHIHCNNVVEEATALKFFWDWDHLLSLIGV